MKLTIVLLTVAFLNVSAAGVSQTVSFSGKNVPLETVFSEMKKQTGFVFLFSQSVLTGTKPVTINAINLPLSDFLDQICKDQPIEYSIHSKSVFISAKTLPVKEADVQQSNVTDSNSLLLQGMLTDVRGRVLNENGEPLIGASIMVKGTNFITLTDDNGYYKIENIPPGNYTVIVTYVGYAKKTATIKVLEGGTAAFDFKLTPSLVNLDEMTVTSTLSKRAIRAYPATIAVINQGDLKNRNVNNLANVLDAIPGIIVQPGSEGGNSGNIRQPAGLLIRGTSAGAPIKYLIDGIEIVSLEYAGQSVLQTLDPGDIEKIEVLKGPMASTLYGSGSASGIISITTKKGKQGKTRMNFKTMFTQYANDYADYNGYNQNYSANISGGSDQFDYLIGAGYNLYPTTKLTDINNGIDDKTWSYNVKIGGKAKNISADVSLQYGKENSGSGSTAISDNKYRASLGLSEYPIPAIDSMKTSQRSFLSSLHLNHIILNNWYQDLTVGYNMVNNSQSNYKRDIYDGTYHNTEFLLSKINARYFMFYDHAWSADFKSSITAGFEYNGFDIRSMGINSTTPLTNFFSVNTPAIENSANFMKSPYSSIGYFAEMVTGFKNNLFLTTGIRFDKNPAYGDNVGPYSQPRIGLSYVIGANEFKIKPRAVWGVSSSPPEPTMKISTVTMYSWGNFITVGNPDLKPQRSEGYEFGADLFYKSNYTLNITWYDQKVKDLIQGSFTYDFTTSPMTSYAYYYNIANSINRGLEISAKAIVDPFTVDLSLTQTTSKWGDEVGQSSSPSVYPHAPSINIPKRSFFARLSYKIPSLFKWSKKGGNISLDWRYNGSSYYYDMIGYGLAADAWTNAPDPKPDYPNFDSYLQWQKGYGVFNLRADYSVTNYATLYIDVQNLMDKQGSINGKNDSRFPGRRINFGFNVNF